MPRRQRENNILAVTSDHAIPASNRNIFVRSSTNSADARLRSRDCSARLHRPFPGGRNHHHAIGEIERPPRAAGKTFDRSAANQCHSLGSRFDRSGSRFELRTDIRTGRPRSALVSQAAAIAATRAPEFRCRPASLPVDSFSNVRNIARSVANEPPLLCARRRGGPRRSH